MLVSKEDDIALTFAVSERLLQLRRRIMRLRGTDLIVPPDLVPDTKRFGVLYARFKKGDFRHSESEMRSVKTIAQWTLDLNRAICGQPSEQIIWKD